MCPRADRETDVKKIQNKTQIERTRMLASLTKIDNGSLDQVRGGFAGKVRLRAEVAF
jgi:hypothetical protein